MKTLYLECGMGAAGDMLLAALYELDPDRKAALAPSTGWGFPTCATLPTRQKNAVSSAPT